MVFLTLSPWKWLASNFSLQYPPWITYLCHMNQENDQLKKLLIFKEILVFSTLENAQ